MSKRFFVDHGTIHDLVTGKHVSIETAARLLLAVSEFDQTSEEAEAELRSEGVDVDAFLTKVHDAVSRKRGERP